VSAFSLSVVFVSSRFIRMINREYLSHDDVTDVVSFPLGSGPGPEGEIYVNLDRAASQARTYKVPVRTETRRLIIHGLLHLLGYDDATDRSKRAMTLRENEYLHQLHSI